MRGHRVDGRIACLAHSEGRNTNRIITVVKLAEFEERWPTGIHRHKRNGSRVSRTLHNHCMGNSMTRDYCGVRSEEGGGRKKLRKYVESKRKRWFHSPHTTPVQLKEYDRIQQLAHRDK